MDCDEYLHDTCDIAPCNDCYRQSRRVFAKSGDRGHQYENLKYQFYPDKNVTIGKTTVMFGDTNITDTSKLVDLREPDHIHFIVGTRCIVCNARLSHG